MGRPAQAPGTWGAIRFERTPEGRVRARGTFRDFAGVRHEASATAIHEAEAEMRLRAKGNRWGGGDNPLGPGTRVSQLSEWWLKRLRASPVVQSTTVKNYARDARVVVTLFGSLELDLLTPALIEHKLLDLAEEDLGAAHRALGTFRRMLERPVVLGVISSNPARPVHIARPPQPEPYALTLEQAEAVRAGFSEWHAARCKPGPRPDARVADMIDLMLVLGLRIGELLALRQCDVKVDETRLLVGGTLVSGDHGEPVWQGYPKNRRQTRELVLPVVAIDALAPYLVPDFAERPVFGNRNGGWMRPGNVRRVLHSFREEWTEELAAAGIDAAQISPHLFRRTLATMLAHAAGIDRAKEQLGHASVTTTERHYVMPPRLVGGSTSRMLDEAFRNRSRSTPNNDFEGS